MIKKYHKIDIPKELYEEMMKYLILEKYSTDRYINPKDREPFVDNEMDFITKRYEIDCELYYNITLKKIMEPFTYEAFELIFKSAVADFNTVNGHATNFKYNVNNLQFNGYIKDCNNVVLHEIYKVI